MTIFVCENSIFGPRWTGAWEYGPLEGDPAFMFFISLFFIFPNFCFFLEQKGSSLISCLSFKHISLLAFVSQFNHRCFLCGRCSMEMWCRDDRGWCSWDGVGPPAWVRACFNSPESGGGSSPVATEPHQIVLLLLLLLLWLFSTRSFKESVYVNKL